VRTTLRASLAAACVAGLAVVPVATAIDTTIRVEGTSATLVPESAIPIEGTGTATVFDRTGAAADVSRGSAFWQLYRATSTTGLGLTYQYFPSFDSILVQGIGPDANAGTDGWQFKVDHVAPQVGPSAAQLAPGDSVLWYFGAGDGARDLDVTLSGDRLAAGSPLGVTVTSYGPDGAPSPAAGALVRYGGATATADSAGHASFVAQAAGTATVVATRAGDVRSPARAVCSYAGDPAACNLPPAAPAGPAPGGTPAGAAALADTVAPGSRITAPRLNRRSARVAIIRGVAGPDRSDVRRVQVALARKVGTQCRFRARSGGYTAPRPCSRQLWVTARSSGGWWALPVGRGRGLAAGSWRVWSRATDGAGNVESVRLSRVNAGAFTVGRARKVAR
jgi:hypothetical protein